MTDTNTFTEALSERMTCTVYGVFDATRDVNKAVPVKVLAGAELIAELAHSLDSAPDDVLAKAQCWLTTMGVHDFEAHLNLAFSQIMADAFHSSSATEFLHGFTGAMEQKFGPLTDSHASDLAAAVILEFCNRPLMIDRTTELTTPA